MAESDAHPIFQANRKVNLRLVAPPPLSGHSSELVHLCLRLLCLPVFQMLLWRLALQSRVRSPGMIRLSRAFQLLFGLRQKTRTSFAANIRLAVCH